MQPEQPANDVYIQPEQDQVVESPELSAQDDSNIQPIQWQAPEYVQERRSPWWFIAFWAITALLVIAALFLFRSWSFALLVPAMAAALMIYSHRPPRILNYVLSTKGMYINEQLHPMAEFKSFGVLREESLPSLMLIPTKRFRPGLTVYFPVELGEAIVDQLGERLPMQELRLDAIDRIVRKLHI
ncbi:MAG: hypothetical protein WBK76_00050 [Candidatus Saccharimonadales bacterium]